MALIRPQRLGRRELHDQHQVPAARVVKLVPSDLESLDAIDRAAERKHALTEGNDVPFARALAILQEDVMLEHRSVPTDPVRLTG